MLPPSISHSVYNLHLLPCHRLRCRGRRPVCILRTPSTAAPSPAAAPSTATARQLRQLLRCELALSLLQGWVVPCIWDSPCSNSRAAWVDREDWLTKRANSVHPAGAPPGLLRSTASAAATTAAAAAQLRCEWVCSRPHHSTCSSMCAWAGVTGKQLYTRLAWCSSDRLPSQIAGTGGYGGYGRKLQAMEVAADATLQRSALKAETACMHEGMSSAAFDTQVRLLSHTSFLCVRSRLLVRPLVVPAALCVLGLV